MQPSNRNSFEKVLFHVIRELKISQYQVAKFLQDEGYSEALSGSRLSSKITDEEAYFALRAEFLDDPEAAAQIGKIRNEQDQDPTQNPTSDSESGSSSVSSASAMPEVEDPQAVSEKQGGELVRKIDDDGPSRLFKPNPILDLSFEEVLTPTRAAEKIEQSTLSRVSSQLGDASGIALQSLDLAREEGRIYFSLSKNGKRLVREGKAYFDIHKDTGKILPTIKSSESDKFLEHVKGVKGGKLSSKITKIGNMVVNAAHIISGMDVVKRIDDVKADTKFLVETRRIDQYAQLESIHSNCREIIDLPDEEVRQKLERSEEKLAFIRNQVRGDIEYKLGQVEDPNQKGWFKYFFSTEKGRDQEVVESTMNAVEVGKFIEASLLMQVALSDRLGRLPRFMRRTLPHEVRKLERVASDIEECAQYLSGNYSSSGLDLQPVVEYFRKMPRRYRSLTTGNSSSPLAEPH